MTLALLPRTEWAIYEQVMTACLDLPNRQDLLKVGYKTIGLARAPCPGPPQVGALILNLFFFLFFFFPDDLVVL